MMSGMREKEKEGTWAESMLITSILSTLAINRMYNELVSALEGFAVGSMLSSMSWYIYKWFKD